MSTSGSPSALLSSLRNRAHRILSVIRLHPFDTVTVEGRSSERVRRVLWSATSSILAKVINTVTLLVSVPITLGYLGAERYGLWMTITSVVAFLGFADLGVGNVILNLVSEAHGRDDLKSARINISNAVFMLVGITIILSLLFVVVYPFVDWPAFFNVSSTTAGNEAGPAMVIFVACFLINLPLSIIPRIQMAYQEGYISSVWQAVSNLLGLGALVMAVQSQAGLPWLVLIIAGFPVLANFLNGISLFGYQRPQLLPTWRDLHVVVFKKIIQVGLLFLILQITNAVISGSDNIIIAKALAPEAVTAYAVPMRLFILFPGVIYMFLTALWPAYGEATVRGDYSWAKRTLKRSVQATFVLSLTLSTMLVVFGKVILELWTDSRVEYSLWLMIGLAAWSTMSAILAAISMFLNAINKIGFQTVYSVLTAISATVAKIILSKNMGVSGVIWAQFWMSTICMLLPYTLYLRRWFAEN